MDLAKILGGLENAEDLIKQIESEVGKEFVPRADFNAKNTELKALQKQIGEMNTSMETLTKEKETFDKTVADLNGKVSSYELSSLKTQIALEKGIPYELAGRLTGEDEESLKSDAESLAKLITSKPVPAPLKDVEPAKGKDDPYKSLLNGLKGE
jgi:chromosome segregation ATPase